MTRLLTFEHRLVQCVFSSGAALARQHDLQHHPFGDRVLAAHECRQHGLELIGLDRREIAELARVDAQQRHRIRVHELHGLEHRAVATDDQHQVEVADEILTVTTVLREPGGLGLRFRQPDLDLVIEEPRGHQARECVRRKPLPMRHEPDRARSSHREHRTMSSIAARSR